MSLKRVTYKSSYDAESISVEEIEKMVERWSQSNQVLGICGLLLVFNGCFIQTIEGHSKHVDELYSKILKDKLHMDVTCLRVENKLCNEDLKYQQ